MKETLLETSQLQTLVTVVKSRSFSKAAEELMVTQSAISQSIKNLEKRVAVKIFNRSGRKVVLTSEGEKLYGLAQDILLRMGDVLEEIHYNKNSMSGKIRLGTLNGVGKSWVAHKLLEFSAQYPQISVSVSMGFQEDLVAAFEKNNLDFLVLPEYAIPHSGEKIYLTDEKSTLVFPKVEGFDIDSDISIEKLSSYPIILFEEHDPLFYGWCRSRFGAIPKKLKGRFVINSHGYMLHAISRGLGIAVIPLHVLKRSSQRDNVMTLGEEFEVANYKFFLVYHKEAMEMLRCQKICEVLSEANNPIGTTF